MATLKSLKKQLVQMQDGLAVAPPDAVEGIKREIAEVEAEIKLLEEIQAAKQQSSSKENKANEGENKAKKTGTTKKTSDKEEVKLPKLSWRYGISYEDLFAHGRVFEINTAGSCSERVGIILEQDTEVFVKGNAEVIAKKGEIVEMVKTDKGDYRQYNIIGEPSDKCLRNAELFKNGKRKELTDKHFEGKTGTKSDKPYTSTDANIPPLDADGKKRIDDEAIAALDKYLAAAKSTKAMHSVNGKYTKERQLLHRQIIAHFTEKAACIKRDSPIAIFMGGLPGSGKTTFIKKKLAWLSSKEIFKIDADEVREMLPEYEGWNASITHEEVVDIMDGYEGMQGLFDKVGGKGCSYDMLYDGTMMSSYKYQELAESLRKSGYKIYTIYVQVEPKVSKERALNRYKDGGAHGRYVPMSVLERGVSKGTTAFEEVKKWVDGWILVDGQSQEILEQGGEALPKDRDYSKLSNQKGSSEQTEQTDKPTRKSVHPEHYASLPMQYKAVADILYLFGEFARIGMASRIVSKVIRREDNRILLELSSAKRGRNGLVATNDTEKQYFLVQEKSRKLTETKAPQGDFVIVDAKAEVLGKDEKSTHSYLDVLYGNTQKLEKCWEIQIAVHECKTGGKCSKEEKEKLNKAVKECKECFAKGFGKYLSDRSSLFDKVFNAQQRGESETDAINRFAETEAA